MADELLKLYIEPTSKCNLKCTMCFRNTWLGEEFSDMDISVFDKTLDTMLPGVETIFFGGMGEPLFHTDILHMVRQAADRCASVELLTNGTLLTREMSGALLDAGLTMLWISLDSIDAGGYNDIRQNASFVQVRRNIEAFNAERTELAKRKEREKAVKLGIAFVAMKSNVGQLGALSRFAYENGVSRVNVSNVLPTDAHSQEESLYSRIVSLGLGSDEAPHPQVSLPMMDGRLSEVRDGLTGLMETDYIPASAGETWFRRRRYCKFIGESVAFVRHDGEVCPCMALLHSGVTYLDGNKRTIYSHSFGNIRERGLRDIWDSGEYLEFRRRVRDFDFSPCIQCGGCENREDNQNDCFGNMKPTCGACLWSEGIISCP